MNFWLQQKSSTFNDLERQFTAPVVGVVYCDEMAEARITRFSRSSSTIRQLSQVKFDHEINGNPFEFQAYLLISLRPELNWCLG